MPHTPVSARPGSPDSTMAAARSVATPAPTVKANGRATSRFAHFLPINALVQATGLTVAYALVERVCDALHIGTLGAPLGFVLLSVLLLSGRLPAESIALGGKWLIGRSTLFLIPAMVAVAPAWPVLRADGLPLIVIIVGGTVATMVATAWSVEATCRWMARRR